MNIELFGLKFSIEKIARKAYVLTADDEADKREAVKNYEVSQDQYDRYLYILGAGSIYLIFTLIGNIDTAKLTINQGVMLYRALLCFAISVSGMLLSFYFSAMSHYTYIKAINRGDRLRGWNNFYTKMTWLINPLNSVCFIVGLQYFARFVKSYLIK